MGRLRLVRAWFKLLLLIRAAPRSHTRRHPRKSALFALRGKQVSPAPANVFWFPLAGRRGAVSPALPGLSSWVVCPHCASPPSPPILTRARFVVRSGRVVRVLALAVRALQPACRPPGPPARLKFVQTFARRALARHRPRGVVWGGVCAELIT